MLISQILEALSSLRMGVSEMKVQEAYACADFLVGRSRSCRRR